MREFVERLIATMRVESMYVGNNEPDVWAVFCDGFRCRWSQDYTERERDYPGGPLFKVYGGLSEMEVRKLEEKKQKLILATGRDLRDEFDGGNCPSCGRRYCTEKGTKPQCPCCRIDPPDLAQLREAGRTNIDKALLYNRKMGGTEWEMIYIHLWSGYSMGINPLKSLRKKGHHPMFFEGYAARGEKRFHLPLPGGKEFTIVLA